METHDDKSHLSECREEFVKKLRKRATKMRSEGTSQITGGLIEESSLAEWVGNGIHLRKMPDDSQGILRISVGGGATIVNLDYCVFRGDRRQCIELLRRALTSLEGDET